MVWFIGGILKFCQKKKFFIIFWKSEAQNDYSYKFLETVKSVPSIGVQNTRWGEIAQSLNFKYLYKSHYKSNEVLWALKGARVTLLYKTHNSLQNSQWFL
jgi:hypothetical protein